MLRAIGSKRAANAPLPCSAVVEAKADRCGTNPLSVACASLAVFHNVGPSLRESPFFASKNSRRAISAIRFDPTLWSRLFV